MEYSIKQQLPYIIILTLISWLYIYIFPTPVGWWSYLLTIPILVGSLYAMRKFPSLEPEFNIVAAFKRQWWLVVAFTIYFTWDAYHKTGTFNIWYSFSMLIMIIIVIVVMERSRYD